jgi:hypothetical protein
MSPQGVFVRTRIIRATHPGRHSQGSHNQLQFEHQTGGGGEGGGGMCMTIALTMQEIETSASLPTTDVTAYRTAC